MNKKVAILGASPKKERYSNQALNMLQEYGHDVIPIHPAVKEIEGVETVASLGNIKDKIDTLTVYVGPQRGEKLIEQILDLAPARVILNPGTESEIIETSLAQAGIKVIKGCTLVMLRTNQF